MAVDILHTVKEPVVGILRTCISLNKPFVPAGLIPLDGILKLMPIPFRDDEEKEKAFKMIGTLAILAMATELIFVFDAKVSDGKLELLYWKEEEPDYTGRSLAFVHLNMAEKSTHLLTVPYSVNAIKELELGEGYYTEDVQEMGFQESIMKGMLRGGALLLNLMGGGQ